MKNLQLIVICFLSLFSSSVLACYESSITKPQPFMGNDGEVFVLSDGSIWEVKFEYEYMYEYYPDVIVCPTKDLLIVSGKKLNIQSISDSSESSGDTIIESYIDGDWNGWDGDTIIKLANGDIWQQVGANLSLSLGLGNEVFIYKKNNIWFMQVEGEDEAVAVMKIN
jgi:hypothetical protein